MAGTAWKSPTAESRILPLTIDELPYALPRDNWKPDNGSMTCTDCKKSFHFLWRRKHHCRRCGFIFCNSCTSKVCIFVNLDQPERICRLCRTILVTNAVRHRYNRLQKYNNSTIPSTTVINNGTTINGNYNNSAATININR